MQSLLRSQTVEPTQPEEMEAAQAAVHELFSPWMWRLLEQGERLLAMKPDLLSGG